MRNKVFLCVFLLFILSFVICPIDVLSISYTDVNLSDIVEFKLDSPVRVRGVVVIEPATLWKTIFYISDKQGQSGVQIYMHKQDFPELALGDLIQVKGVISEAYGERRIKVKEKQDFQILEHLAPLQAEDVSIDQITKEKIGTLVKITGQLIEKKGDSFYVDDGTGEIRVVIKSATNIDKSQFNEGDWLSLTGLVSQTTSGYRILPRFPEDLEITSSENSSETGSVDELNIPAGNRGRNLVKYLTVAAVALAASLAGLAYQRKTKAKIT